VELLISNKIKEAEELVQEIIAKDTARKGIVDDGVGIINSILDMPTLQKEKVIFIASNEVTRGTTGLLANRLSLQFQLPSVVVADDGNMASGSVRAPGNFDVVKMLQNVSPILVQFGGHKSAGGFILKSENLEQFRARLVEYMLNFNPDDFIDEISIDAEIENLDEINLNMIRYLENILEPIGNGNEITKILIKRVKIGAFREIGKTNAHGLMTLQKNGKEISAIGWNFADKIKDLLSSADTAGFFDMIVSPEINRYQGAEEARASIIDIKKSV
jgi:single-stranded-DNA-specific exonuclease